MHNITINVLPKVSLNDIYFKMSFYQKISTGYRRLILSIEDHFCGFLNGTSQSFIIRMIWPFLKTCGNLDHKCPFTGYVYLHNVVVKSDYFPPALPEGQGKFEIHIRNGPKRVSIIKLILFLEIKPKGAAILNF
ncbi:unnamed protein product [Hermetia illucens]|uniref:Uncharacterized protein n=2 Tax=Hermetia illucens TaxID=343691 RepID=A0A7R8UZ75_HERIL|nr:unnamed protein product [Hermetia illucens]